MGSLGNYLYRQMESFAEIIDEKLKKSFPENIFFLTGEFRRQLEIITVLSWVTTVDKTLLQSFFIANAFAVVEETTGYFSCKGKDNVTLGFYCCTDKDVYAHLFETSCSEEFLTAWKTNTTYNTSASYPSEAAIFSTASVHPIPVYRREDSRVIGLAKQAELTKDIQPEDIRGIIHSHSTWSDGADTLDQMARVAIDRGYQYLVISDHSKSAFYANGLSEERIYAQQQQVNELNTKLAPFKIFKSIESDILNDGSLDYANPVLNSFDLVIASVHSNLKMNEEKAMMRLLKAIENPFTAILGHMTGRLLLSRNGYPVNHQLIIEACAANNVVIELNAHPRRLDIDWRWINYALEKNVLISIDPDAHSTDGYNDCRYGVLTAQKAGLQQSQNLSSFALAEFEAFVAIQKNKRL
jgi:DNA polymerase (family 10)